MFDNDNFINMCNKRVQNEISAGTK